MSKRLVLVDFENVQTLDLSTLDDSYRAIVFVGASQTPPKAARSKATAHRFSRVDFQRIEGNGKNALDFHIAFHLGRTFETAPQTECFELSKDKGYDPLLVHLNKNGLSCRRIVSLDELLPEVSVAAATELPGQVVCRRCGKSSTIEHHGGQWCVGRGTRCSPLDFMRRAGTELSRLQLTGRAAATVDYGLPAISEAAGQVVAASYGLLVTYVVDERPVLIRAVGWHAP